MVSEDSKETLWRVRIRRFDRCRTYCYLCAKHRRVGPFREFNPNRVILSDSLVVLPKLRSDLATLNANYRVEARIKLSASMKDFDAKHVFLQLISAALEGSFDCESKERFKACRGHKQGTVENAFQLNPDVGMGRLSHGVTTASDIVPVLKDIDETQRTQKSATRGKWSEATIDVLVRCSATCSMSNCAS